MTTRNLIHALLAVVLVAGTIPAGAAASGLTDTATDRTARLAVEQPAYVDGDAREDLSNGTRVYYTSGSPVDLKPQNFDADNVVDYGVSTDVAQLHYDEEMGTFELRTSTSGTYRVFWVVTQQVTTTEPAANNTTTTTTVTKQFRYTARIRATGPFNMTHLQQGTLEATREDAQKWREFNATVQELRHDNMWVALGLQPPLSTEETVQEMVNAYRLKNDPLQFLSGTAGMILFMLVSTLGGLLVFLLFTGYHTVVVGYITRKVNVFESTERDEGAIAKRIEDDALRQKFKSLANTPFSELYNDDHVAEAMADEGRNPKQAFTNFWSRISPRERVRWWVQVMGQNGYVGRVEDDDYAVPDGGEGSETPPVPDEITVVRASEVSDDATTVSLGTDDTVADVTFSSLPDELLDAIPDWSAAVIREFDPADHEWDGDEIDVQTDDAPATLPEYIEQSNLDLRNFEDQQAAGEYLLTILEHARDEALTDDRGEVDPVRYMLEEHLDAANVLRDRFGIPVDAEIKSLNAAIQQHDKTAEARDRLDDIRDGRYA